VLVRRCSGGRHGACPDRRGQLLARAGVHGGAGHALGRARPNGWVEPSRLTLCTLRKADVLLGEGKRVAEVVKALGVSEVKLRDELLDREIFHSLREAQVVIEAWHRYYTIIRHIEHLATGRRRRRPSHGRSWHGHQPRLVRGRWSCITDDAPGPDRRGRSVATCLRRGPVGGPRSCS
jgi:hypothetical protein